MVANIYIYSKLKNAKVENKNVILTEFSYYDFVVVVKDLEFQVSFIFFFKIIQRERERERVEKNI